MACGETYTKQGKITCQFLGKLISAGADINEENEEGLTPLLLACRHQVDPGKGSNFGFLFDQKI